MSPPASRATSQLVAPIAVIWVVLVYLGFGSLSSLLASMMWLAQGVLGGAVLEYLLGRPRHRHRIFVVLGPGALLGIGVSISLYLVARGGIAGTVLVVLAVLGGVFRWVKHEVIMSEKPHLIRAADLVVVAGCALVANSREFPALLVPGLVVTASSVAWIAWRQVRHRVAMSFVITAALVYGAVSRPLFWWWSSDDTTTLSAIGTMVIEQGRVADLAGWHTGSHHWMLHAWLALWNQLATAQIFETYLIAWPFVAVVSTFVSLWLFVELAIGRTLEITQLAVVALATGGLLRFEWPAPQEQQPFLFAMAACCALWLTTHQPARSVSYTRAVVSVVTAVFVLPAWLFVLKPSLLVAYGLLIVGTALHHFDLLKGKRIMAAVVVSASAIAFGISVMALGESWVSARSFTSFSVDFFPDDLGWCRYASRPGSLACVISLQAVLILAAVLAAAMLWLARRNSDTDERIGVSPMVLLPLVIAYVPLRYFVSSGVGSGAPSFYRLSEMALVLVVALGLGTVMVTRSTNWRVFVLLFGIAGLAAVVSRTPSRAYDVVDSWLVKLSPLRYLNAADVIMLVFVFVAALVVVRYPQFRRWPSRHLAVVLCLVSLTPLTRTALASATETTPDSRLERPEDLGPSDVDEVAAWLRNNTRPGTLLATNYLCSADRLDECTHSISQHQCARLEPALMAGWALVSISERDFLYLSQYWDTSTIRYFDHQLSSRLGSEVSIAAVDDLEARRVAYYVASKAHSDTRAWQQLRDTASFATENFAVVSLLTLMQRLSG